MTQNRKLVKPKHLEWVTCCDIPGFTACLSLDSRYRVLNQSVHQITAYNETFLCVGKKKGGITTC